MSLVKMDESRWPRWTQDHTFTTKKYKLGFCGRLRAFQTMQLIQVGRYKGVVISSPVPGV